jgi:hypothetical protein
MKFGPAVEKTGSTPLFASVFCAIEPDEHFKTVHNSKVLLPPVTIPAPES